jgi:ABC-2 type transport system ATP-binding protein
MNVLEVKNLRKEYMDFTLDNVSMTIPKGYIMGFVGENGAGKTTTIKAILNHINKNSGEVSVFGQNMETHEIEIKQRIGYVSGDIFYPKRKLKDVTNVFKRFFDKWDQAVYEKYLVKFNLNEEKKIDELSKGMFMKYALSLQLSHNAELLILDEPTSGLDPVARDQILEIFQQLVIEDNVTILYSTHITTDLEKCADYITFIQDGKIIESCSKDELLDDYRLVNGSKESFELIKDQLISSKENAFGFNGMVKTKDAKEIKDIRYARPSIEDIVIFFAERKDV